MPRSMTAVIREAGDGVELALQEGGHDPHRVERYRSLEAALEDNPGYQWRLADSNEGAEHAVLRVAEFLE